MANIALERAVAQGGPVLAMDCVLAMAQWRHLRVELHGDRIRIIE